MPITPLSVVPNSITSPATFNTDMDTHLGELQDMITEFNVELAANTSTGVDAAAAAVLATAEAVNAHNEATAAASAALASSSVDCACTGTPFIDVTVGNGHESETRQPDFLMRLSKLNAINESSSLNPSKVSMAICIGTSL